MNFLNSNLKSVMTMKDTEDHIHGLRDVLRFPKVKIYGLQEPSVSRMFTVGALH